MQRHFQPNYNNVLKVYVRNQNIAAFGKLSLRKNVTRSFSNESNSQTALKDAIISSGLDPSHNCLTRNEVKSPILGLVMEFHVHIDR